MSGVRASSVEIALGEPALALFPGKVGADDAYWRCFLEETPEVLAPNLSSNVGLVRCGDRAWPLSLHEGGLDLSYPCSLATQYVRYPLEELSMVRSRWARLGAWLGLKGLGGFLGVGEVDRTVQWSSGLLSTNLHPPELPLDAPEVTEALVTRFPEHAVLVKNIHGYEDATLIGWKRWVMN
jgi:hypothetical protein